MSEFQHISKVIDEWADKFDNLRGESMSESQKTQAEQVIDHADKMLLEGFDSLTVLRRGLHKLNQLGLNVYDFTRYKRRLELVAGVK
jgi:hypothetical protein